MEPIRIEVPITELKYQKPTAVKSAVLELHDTHLFYLVNFMAQEPTIQDDEYAPFKEVQNYFRIVALKQFICGIEMSLHADGKLWGVWIMVSGFGSDIKMWFSDKKAAMSATHIIHKWLLN